MKLVRSSQSKVFTYDNSVERLAHIEKMEQEGWTCSGKVKEFIGKLLIDDTTEEKNYVYIGEFYREG